MKCIRKSDGLVYRVTNDKALLLVRSAREMKAVFPYYVSKSVWKKEVRDDKEGLENMEREDEKLRTRTLR